MAVPPPVMELIRSRNNGTSVRELEALAGKTPGWVARNTETNRLPTPRTLEEVAAALRVTVDELDYALRAHMGYRLPDRRPLRAEERQLLDECQYLPPWRIAELVAFAQTMRAHAGPIWME